MRLHLYQLKRWWLMVEDPHSGPNHFDFAEEPTARAQRVTVYPSREYPSVMVNTCADIIKKPYIFYDGKLVARLHKKGRAYELEVL